MVDLKPCPFCGGEADLSNDACQDSNGGKLWSVECPKCGVFVSEKDKNVVLQIWNTRKPMEEAVAELEAFARENDREPNAGFIDMCIEIVRGKE